MTWWWDWLTWLTTAAGGFWLGYLLGQDVAEDRLKRGVK